MSPKASTQGIQRSHRSAKVKAAQKQEGGEVELARFFGLKDEDVAKHLLSQMMRMRRRSERGTLLEEAEKTVLSFKLQTLIDPKDGIEAMLATQMAASHENAMDFVARAARATTVEGVQLYSGIANKFLRTYLAQLDALNRHRGKGAQKVTVEHVNVHHGGQAIVGSVAVNPSPQDRMGGSEHG